MLKRMPVSAALAGLALIGALSACASTSQHSVSAGASASVPTSKTTSAQPSSSAQPSPSSSAQSSAGTSSSPPPVSGVPIVFAVKLGRGFTPSNLRVSPGQQFEVIVESSVKSGGPSVPSSCSGRAASKVNNGMLAVHCKASTYYYTAERAGTTELMTTVRPNCAKGSICPQWVAVATLKITII